MGNATSGVNALTLSIKFRRGDELLLTLMAGNSVDELRTTLFERHRFEVPVIPRPLRTAPQLLVSAMRYNREVDYAALAAALQNELGFGPDRNEKHTRRIKKAHARSRVGLSNSRRF